MKDIKKYVLDNYEYDASEPEVHALYRRFMRIVDKINVKFAYDKFSKMLDYYTDPEMGSCYYLMMFICLLDEDKRILNANLSVIDDIVRGIYNASVTITNYKKCLDIILDARVLNYLNKAHENKRELKIQPMNILINIIEDIDFLDSKEENINKICEYYQEVLESKKDDDNTWFKGIDDFDRLSSIVKEKMQSFNELSQTFGGFDVYSEEEINQVSYISKLKYMDLERQGEILRFYHEYDEENKPLREKCDTIVSTAKSYYQNFGNDKIIYADFSRKI